MLDRCVCVCMCMYIWLCGDVGLGFREGLVGWIAVKERETQTVGLA